MIYLKSASRLCSSYKSVTLYLQLSLTKQPKSTGCKTNSLSRKDSPEVQWPRGWPVQWLSIPIQAPGSSSPALPRSSYASLLRDITRHHIPARKRSMKDSTLCCRTPWIFEETFSKNNPSAISFVYGSRIGSYDHFIAGMRRDYHFRLKLIRIYPRFHKEKWIPKLCQQTGASNEGGYSTVSTTNPHGGVLQSLRNRSPAQCLQILSYQIKTQTVPKLHSMVVCTLPFV